MTALGSGTAAEPFTVRAIGVLRTPFATRADCPRNGRQPRPPPLCHAEVFPAFVPGLKDLDGFSHLILLYWMDQARSAAMMFRPPFDTVERGLFATRSPDRPNPIGLAVVAFEGFTGMGRLGVRYLDCVNGTPLIDIKPYLPTTDADPSAAMGWLAQRPG